MTWNAYEMNVMQIDIQTLKPWPIELSWIPQETSLDVNVDVVAKHHPTLLDETFKFKLR